MIEVWFVWKWELSGLDENFWVEGSKSVMENSKKLSFRWYSFCFCLIYLSLFSSISILSFKNSLLIDLKSIITLTISLWILLISARFFCPLICFIVEYILWSKWFISNSVAMIDFLIVDALAVSYFVWNVEILNIG